MPHGSDYVAPPAPRPVTLMEFTVPRGHVLCSCGGVIRLRANGTLTKHDAWTRTSVPSASRSLGACPRSGEAAQSGARL